MDENPRNRPLDRLYSACCDAEDMRWPDPEVLGTWHSHVVNRCLFVAHLLLKLWFDDLQGLNPG
jgi:hypothetical protein